jgi:hypothetical protein
MEQVQGRMVFLGNHYCKDGWVGQTEPITHMSNWVNNNRFWGLPQADNEVPTEVLLRRGYLGLYSYDVTPLYDDTDMQRKLIYSVWENEAKALWENGSYLSLHQFRSLIQFFPEKIQEELMQAIYRNDFSIYEGKSHE